MKSILTSLALAIAMTCATGAAAKPYCTELNEKAQLPKKYQKRGPFYSDQTSGWIIGHDQLKSNFVVTNEVTALWHSIAMEFERHGAKLVVLAAPPRPLFAPADMLGQMNLLGDFDLTQLQDGFSAYITALNTVGIVAPDLSKLAQIQTTNSYYFARDTHWTPMGAAISVAHLKESIDQTPVYETISTINASKTYEEKGSLSGVVETTCGTRPGIETVPSPQFAQQGSAESLFADTADKDAIALVGTSFSDRYQRDAYQVADALSFVMDATVENYSVTGGGLVGAMEAFIRSGALKNGRFKTVVWEAPYSTPLTRVAGLRQILGALLTYNATPQSDGLKTAVGDKWTTLEHSFSTAGLAALEIETANTTSGQLVVELFDTQGISTRVKIEKTDRIAAQLRNNRWALALNGLPNNKIVKLKLRLKGATTQESANIRFFK
ncbi:MAG: alginate biosynthesis protein AlgX [Candidatus Azotimanducaceae bacterium]|jgi:alginate biosynthesis protein AlgX